MRHFPITIATYLLTVCLFDVVLYGNLINNVTKSGKTVSGKKSFVAMLFSTNVTAIKPNSTQKEMCRWLRGLRHQDKICKKKEGLPQLLEETKKLAVSSCVELFQYEQWNCSKTTIKNYFKSVYRETALMYSLATSALMYVISRACAEGKLTNCKCASHGRSDNISKWDWGGCGDNTKYAKKLTKHFLQLRKKGDSPNNVMKYNSEVGMKVVLQHKVKECQCHGISKSCTYKTCFMRIRPFREIASTLWQLYHTAIPVESDNNIRYLKQHRKRNLVYLENSPNFCNPRGAFGVTTTGRRCKDINNCATLCCTRKHVNVTEVFADHCNCRWKHESKFEVDCEKCYREEVFYYCL
ncbi:hypothetical protein GWI33_014327 [Rhynchophorus ferrugineus]|uniref:Protein Wnt n=1 Tax=Rhynchophorus ferrugineus TaxID=354439 RepID=A0A834M5N0_RHYFE|nr:hypothetical protein GWI33_014327 [Rhynchophorus ferrugineus]